MSLQPSHSCHKSQWTQVNLNASVDRTHMLSVYTGKQFTWRSTIQVNCSHPLPRHGNGTTVNTNNRSSVTPAPEFLTFSFLWNSFTRRMAIYTHASRTRVHCVTSTEGNCQDRGGARDCMKTGGGGGEKDIDDPAGGVCGLASAHAQWGGNARGRAGDRVSWNPRAFRARSKMIILPPLIFPPPPELFLRLCKINDSRREISRLKCAGKCISAFTFSRGSGSLWPNTQIVS